MQAFQAAVILESVFDYHKFPMLVTAESNGCIKKFLNIVKLQWKADELQLMNWG